MKTRFGQKKFACLVLSSLVWVGKREKVLGKRAHMEISSSSRFVESFGLVGIFGCTFLFVSKKIPHHIRQNICSWQATSSRLSRGCDEGVFRGGALSNSADQEKLVPLGFLSRLCNNIRFAVLDHALLEGNDCTVHFCGVRQLEE